jgi:hypothetical protein
MKICKFTLQYQVHCCYTITTIEISAVVPLEAGLEIGLLVC